MAERLMKDSGVEWIGKIPNNWLSMKLKHIKSDEKYAIVDGPFGTAISTDDYVDEGVPLIRITNIKSPYISNADMVFITEEHAANLQRSRLNINDIVFAKTGATIGKCGINNHIEYGILSSSCVKIAISNNHNNKYFYYLFYTDQFNKSLKDACVGTTRDTINLVPFSNLKVCVPSLEEQTRIADFLDKKVSEIDNVIAKTKESIEEYKKLKQSIITEAVTKGLDPNVETKDSGEKSIGNIPEKWKMIPLKYLCNYNEKTLKENTNPEYEFDYIDIGSVEYGKGITKREHMKFKDAPSRARRILEEGDIVVSTVRTYLKAISEIPGCSNDQIGSTGFIVIKNKPSVSNRFLKYAILADYFINAVISNSVGISYPAINAEDIVQFKIAIPELFEQESIAKHLDQKCSKYDSLISKKEQVLLELEQYKKSLIYEYVTGKKEVI